MFSQVDLKSFRQFETLALKDARRVNLLVGNNDGGKTTILEALRLLADPLTEGGWRVAARTRHPLSPGNRIPTLRSIAWLFRSPNVIDASARSESEGDSVARGKLSIQGAYTRHENAWRRLDAHYLSRTEERPVDRSSLRWHVRYDSRQDQEDGAEFEDSSTELVSVLAIDVVVDDDREHEKRKVHLEFTNPLLDYSAVGDGRPDIPVAYVAGGTRGPSDDKLWTQAVQRGEDDALLAVLKRLDDRIQDLTILEWDDRPVLHVETPDGLIPSFVFGNGFRRLVEIGAHITRAEGGLLLIDELEDALHPEAMSPTVQWLVEEAHHRDIQLWIATHSIEVVDAFLKLDEGTLKEIVAFRLSGAHDGIGRVDRLEGKQLRQIRYKYGQEVR